MSASAVEMVQGDGYWIGRFNAMASPCELLIEEPSRQRAERLTRIAANEAWRIEAKFSRYRTNNIVALINNANGQSVDVDSETANLLDLADNCYQLSEGLFDITSGILRRAWRFDGSDRLPNTQAVESLLPYVGWHKVRWERPTLKLRAGMEIDLGGLGKEYAVDRCAMLLQQHHKAGLLINFGGDIFSTGPRQGGIPWTASIEDPDDSGATGVGQIRFLRGGLTTSGDARRFLLKDGVRYSHILNPKTGWPIPDAPRSVTVLANGCMEAGLLSTLAMLRGKDATLFIKSQGVPYWVCWASESSESAGFN